MLKYLEVMVKEIDEWRKNPNCTSFSDQGIHNYLFNSKQLPFAISMENGVDGIVNTAGYVAEAVLTEHVKSMTEKYNVSEREGK